MIAEHTANETMFQQGNYRTINDLSTPTTLQTTRTSTLPLPRHTTTLRTIVSALTGIWKSQRSLQRIWLTTLALWSPTSLSLPLPCALTLPLTCTLPLTLPLPPFTTRSIRMHGIGPRREPWQGQGQGQGA